MISNQAVNHGTPECGISGGPRPLPLMRHQPNNTLIQYNTKNNHPFFIHKKKVKCGEHYCWPAEMTWNIPSRPCERGSCIISPSAWSWSWSAYNTVRSTVCRGGCREKDYQIQSWGRVPPAKIRSNVWEKKKKSKCPSQPCVPYCTVCTASISEKTFGPCQTQNFDHESSADKISGSPTCEDTWRTGLRRASSAS